MLAATAVVVVGCGGSGGLGASSASRSSAKAAFAAQAGAICLADLEARQAALTNSGGNVLRIVSRLDAADGTAVAQLAKLTAPGAQKAAFTRFVADLRALNRLSGPAALAPNGPSSQLAAATSAAATAAGLRACAIAYGPLPGAAPAKPLPRHLSPAATGARALPSRLEVVESPVAGSPLSIGVGASGIWVGNADGTITKIDPRSGRLSTPVSVGDQNVALAVGPGVVWVADEDRNSVARIDASADRLQGKPIPVGSDPTAIAVGDGTVWVANWTAGTLSRISLDGAPLGPAVTVGDGPDAVAVGDDVVWVANVQDNTVTRIDALNGAPFGTPIAVGRGPSAIAVGQGGVWVLNSLAATVTRIDPQTGRVVGAPVRVGSNPRAIAVGYDSVWVAEGQDSVTRIDARTGRVVGRPIVVGANPSSIAAGQGGVWVASDGTVSLIRP